MPTSLLTLDHDILTTGDNDPLLTQLLHAINHASEIEISVSFIRQSGFELIKQALLDVLENKRHNHSLKLRILTSDYLGITEPVAPRGLLALEGDDVQIKVFETDKQSFHMKSYLFVRTNEQGIVTEGSAFIGSNNISRPALTNAHEWTLRYDYKANSDSHTQQQFFNIRQKFNAIFEHPNAKTLSDEWIDAYIPRRQQPALKDITLAVTEEEITEYWPNLAQEEALTALNTTRLNGYERGLVVMGTGMGKTFLAAFDAQQMKAKRVLFIAHREEILSQALSTFAKVHPDKSSGYYHGKAKEAEKDLLFASVQTIGKESHLNQFAPDHFDYVVIDEFHHASASTYQNVLNYFEPKFLLGLTATPERTDQANILALCHNNLVFERNLVHGIDEKILVPFHYYGIWDDSVDYQAIPWRNGKFDPEAIENQFATQKRAAHIFKHWQTHQQQRTLAFCMSKRHADYMADYFNTHFAQQNKKAIAVYSGSKVLRNEALTQLDNGDIDVIFSVDLFNEGTDLPSIDTVMMLRPTESNIVFLQQLGRGLRRHQDKTHLVVIDFIGNHNSFFSKQSWLGIDIKGANGGEPIDRPAPELGEGTYINIDPQAVDFWQRLARQLRTSAKEDFAHLTAYLGHRPSASEFYIANKEDRFAKVNKQHGSWCELVAEMSDDALLQEVVTEHRDFLFYAVQGTKLQKSFKAILLEAFISLDGFRTPPTIDALCQRSRKIIDGYPSIKAKDFTGKEAQVAIANTTGGKWQKYWEKNPVHFSMQADKKTNIAWFTQVGERYQANFAVKEQHVELLSQLVKELVDYRLVGYLVE